jgi:hypothetical protein
VQESNSKSLPGEGFAIFSPGIVLLTSLCCRSDSESPVHTAAKIGHLEIVRLLVDHGADVNSEWSEHSTTPLRQAIDVKHAAVADYLRSVGGLEKSFRAAASDGDINMVRSWLLTSPKVVKRDKQ